MAGRVRDGLWSGGQRELVVEVEVAVREEEEAGDEAEEEADEEARRRDGAPRRAGRRHVCARARVFSF